MPEKIIYCSPAWFEMLEEQAQAAVDKAGAVGRDAAFSLLERYHDAPADQHPSDDLMPGFRLDIGGGKARIRPGAGKDETADLVLDITWEGANRIAGQKSGPALDALMVSLIEAGTFTVQGDMDALPADMMSFHDEVWVRTQTYF